MSDAVKIMFFCLGVDDNVVQIAKQKPRLFRVSLIINAKKNLVPHGYLRRLLKIHTLYIQW